MVLFVIPDGAIAGNGSNQVTSLLHHYFSNFGLEESDATVHSMLTTATDKTKMLSSSSYMTMEPAYLSTVIQPTLCMVRVSESQSVKTTSTDTFPLLRQALALPTYAASSQRNILSGTIRTINSIGATLNILEPR